ncbi:hypothetical protein [Alicyclobacillus ferrooxydans]|uniref:Lipoprotein n=1 Tax=Alicyclobacillus ferrooxydans TaxID=471514 RepID=A0A0P9EWG3_9BACL|nr:hypothetical protein [Alicyclobacillus ferrooxydans]KPV43427.1 hypothetical protein AN477_12605 [Alicyclobacillus ferrooxydans]
MKKLMFGVIATATVFAAACTPVFASVSNSGMTNTSYTATSTKGSTTTAGYANGTGKTTITANRFEEFFG